MKSMSQTLRPGDALPSPGLTGWLSLLLLALRLQAAPSTIWFETGFEANEGYSTSQDLSDHADWQALGSSQPFWNGVLTGAFEGVGQQAYVGFSNPGEASLPAVYTPLNLDPVALGLPKVTFSVDLAIMDSSSGRNYDEFWWSVYNRDAKRLLTIAFNNLDFSIVYWPEGATEAIPTGVPFQSGTIHRLQIEMDFSANVWSARLDNTTLVTSQTLSVTGVTLDLGDIDAEWALVQPSAPGDNYMVFDNYRVTGSPAPSPADPPHIQILGMDSRWGALLRITGTPGATWVVEAGTPETGWTGIRTNAPPDGLLDVIDSDATFISNRMYRVRALP